jgi:hypothetical protein
MSETQCAPALSFRLPPMPDRSPLRYFLNRQGDDRAEVRKAQQTAERVTRENLIKSIGRQASGQVSITNFSAADGVVAFDARFRNPNFFAGIVGLCQDMPVNIETQALYGGDGQLPVRVAMVLDNSGSMAGTKLTNLKDAARRFVPHHRGCR